MSFPVGAPLTLLADASAASGVMRSYVTPVVATLCVLASLASTFFLVNGGIQYMTSSGNPEKLQRAKKIIKNALIGLVLVIAAATLTAILSHAYSASGAAPAQQLPTLQPINTEDVGNKLAKVLVDAVVGLLRVAVEQAAKPFLSALSYFLNSTPLMGDNSSVFNLWLAVVGIADVLFVVVVALLGFQIMSFSTLGFDELDIKQLLPQIAVVFLLANTSIFAIDAVISFSNAMIRALQSGFPSTDIWSVLIEISKKSDTLGIAGLLVMVAFLTVSVMLLVYYVSRLITLYLGAILSPLIMLLWLIPAFKDFAITALKTYLMTIFVLFVHVVILLLAASIFTGMLAGDSSGQPNALMSLIVGLATVMALLKTQGFMQEVSYAASVPRAAREMAGTFIKGFHYTYQTGNFAYKAGKTATKAGKKVYGFIKARSGGGSQASGEKGGSGSGKSGAGNSRGTSGSQKSGSASKVKQPKKGQTVRASKTEKKR